MYKKLTDFPTKHIENNLVFGRNNTVWAYFEIEGFGYDFRDLNGMKMPFQNQMGFLVKNASDIHYLLLPHQVDPSHVLDSTMADIQQRPDYVLKDSGLEYLRRSKKALSGGDFANNGHQYHSFIGIQLDPKRNVYKEGNAGLQVLAGLKGLVEGLNAPVRKAWGLDPYDILESDIAAWQQQAEMIQQEMAAAFSSPARPVTAQEAMSIAEYSFKLSKEKATLRQWEMGQPVSGDLDGEEIQAVRPNKDIYYQMQNAKVTPHGHKTLLLEKQIDDETAEEYVRYLVVDQMSSANYHPGFEWLYQIQTDLPFPIGVSIRACHKPNKVIRKELSNAKLGFDDQRKEAARAKVRMEKSVESKEAGNIQMEDEFQKSGHPAYACSFVLRIAGETENEVDKRVEAARRELGKKGITLQNPFGDALKYFMEFIPGSERVASDYWQQVSPGILAAMMFGATTNIGDNRGFLIGFTKKLRKPVFIQPDLAAKGFADTNNLFDSLSVMVAGEVGKGKSVFMNLFAMLSALTLGSQVLILDPKGDRKGWAKGLPFIGPEHISVWTLGEDPADAGALDPFRTSGDIREGKDLAMDILSYLAGVDLDDDKSHKYSLLSEAVEAAGNTEDPCVQAVLNHLKDLAESPPERFSENRKEDVQTLLNTLESLEKNQLALLLFGKIGQDYRSLNVKKPIQVLMVQNLQLPESKKIKKRPVEKISEAIMISLTAFTKQYSVKKDRSIHTLIAVDENKSIEDSDMGRDMLEWMVRKGRFNNSTLLKATQNATDFKSAANIGMKVCFQLNQATEAEQMLKYFNLPITRNNVAQIQNLKKGECLFQDIYGRSAIISINSIFKEILLAFRTNTASDAEIEYEKERQKIGV